MAEGDDKVGYKNPPRPSRFAKGRSGNPGGRPRKLPSLRSELEAELAEEIAVADGDDGGARITKLRGIAKAMVEAALRGDMRAVNAIVGLSPALSEPADAEQTLLCAEVFYCF